MIGYFNGRMGSHKSNQVVRAFVENNVTDNEEILIQYNGMKTRNGFQKHKNIHRFTWALSIENLESVIDYTNIKQNTKLKINDGSVESCNRRFRSNLVRAKILVPYSNQIIRKTRNEQPEKLTEELI